MQINIKKLFDEAFMPLYATMGSACFDIFSMEEGKVMHGAGTVFRTGLAFEIPEGYVMLIFSRSGDGFKRDVRLANCVGVIDSDYRGELMVKLASDCTGCPAWVSVGDRIAQGMIIPIPAVGFKQVEDLSNTARGTGGLGSTGQ